jgi:hypothetical protein
MTPLYRGIYQSHKKNVNMLLPMMDLQVRGGKNAQRGKFRRYQIIEYIKILPSRPRTYIDMRNSEQLPVGLLS